MSQLARLDLLVARMERGHDDLFGHTHRVGDLAARLAIELGFAQPAVEEIRLAARLHDIGKLALDDRVLDKPGPLSPSELIEIRRHPQLGFEMIRDVVPAAVAIAVRHHHERWDGTGYPDRLAGRDIPVASRIILIADAFDAMTSDRCYQPPLQPLTALREIEIHRGTQFDPVASDRFLQLIHTELVAA